MTNFLSPVLTGASVLAMLAAFPALAETKIGAGVAAEAQAGSSEQTTNPRGPSVTQKDIDSGLAKAEKAITDTAEAVADSAGKAVDDIRAILLDEPAEGQKFVQTSYKVQSTAQGMIGAKVTDSEGKDVATIHDIIINADGKAELLILADGGFFGIGGKMAALDYKSVVDSGNEGEIVKKMSKETINDVAEFSYAPGLSGKVKIMSADGISLRDLLMAHVIGPDQKQLANVENITFDSGKTDKLIVAFDQTLGLGGDLAALDFDDAELIRTADKKINFQFSKKQAAAFEKYKSSVVNQ